LDALWYNQPYLKHRFKKGEQYFLSGKVNHRQWPLAGGDSGRPRPVIESPDYELYTGRPASFGKIIPVYPSTAGLTQKLLRSLIRAALSETLDQVTDFAPVLEDSLGPRGEILPVHPAEKCDRRFAVANIHFPESPEAFLWARGKLVFDELFLLQAALTYMKGTLDIRPAPVFACDVSELLDALPFKFTPAQRRVWEEIRADLSSGMMMNRLIQGDVGSGKTALAMASAFAAARSAGEAERFQTALLAPTEVLARQHFETFKKYFQPLGVTVSLLTGSLSAADKNLARAAAASGESGVVIGTHALLQDSVAFKNLGLVITDEQHRFGVRQRALLAESKASPDGQGLRPHVMVMSATPIPRTLALILYGDLCVSTIDTLPPGRQKIKTYAVTSAYRRRIYNFINKQVDEGRQAYIICPAVDTSVTDVSPMESVLAYAEKTRAVFQDRAAPDGRATVACLHGKMKPADKQGIMAAFADGAIKILIATTVVEVGVNVPNATVMVVENAERFGLAQLHQLRGRVGRGPSQSYCVLITDSQSQVCAERMRALSAIDDGFVLSEMDLKLRGPGDFFGTAQHGLPEMQIANLYTDLHILKLAQTAAQELFKADPRLERTEGGRRLMDKIKWYTRGKLLL
jgi:ATP-dependent DNA helicase RecG